MPPPTMVTSTFLKQVLKNEKRLLKISAVSKCNPPRYDEISVTKLYGACLEMDGMKDYFPDEYPKGRQCSREYFFSVLATLHPEYTQKLLMKSKADRFSLQSEDVKKESIVMSEAWQ